MPSRNIPRNVNYYSHFLKHEYITENDIEWVLKLRGDDEVYNINKAISFKSKACS